MSGNPGGGGATAAVGTAGDVTGTGSVVSIGATAGVEPPSRFDATRTTATTAADTTATTARTNMTRVQITVLTLTTAPFRTTIDVRHLR